MSRNNRLLNHRATGQRTLQIVDELPGEIYRRLVEEGRTLQFLSMEEAPPEAKGVLAESAHAAADARSFPSPGTPGEGQGGGRMGGGQSDINAPLGAAPPPPQPSPGVPGEGENRRMEEGVSDNDPPLGATPPPPQPSPGVPGEGENRRMEEGVSDNDPPLGAAPPPPRPSLGVPGEGEEPELAALPLAPVADAAPAERHRDNKLQTALEGEKLQARLVNLAREANSAIQEQGCNILYLTFGVVEWRDAESANETSRAPVIFVPVELKRKSVNARYTLQAFDDDVVGNPSLVELCQNQFNFALPAFDAEKDEAETYLKNVEEAVAHMPGWKFTSEIHLGLFSFSKLLMYRDLDPRNWPAANHLADHALIQSLTLGTAPEAGDGNGIPDPHQLDEMVDPADCFQIVDADSSQQSAILGAKRGLSMVIDGPPGTGKSQTITNIIAESLAAGQTVLFVSEKSAALEVVKRRLTEAGLGDFVLELHSRQASKRAVLEEINRVLERDATARQVTLAPAQELRATRDRLNAYHRDLHTPLGALAISPFQAMSAAIALVNEPEAHCDIPDVMGWSAQQLTEADQKLAGLDRCLARVGDESAHPWRGVWLPSAGLREKQRIGTACEALVRAIKGTLEAGSAVASMLAVSAPRTRLECEQQCAAAGVLVAAPASVADVVMPGVIPVSAAASTTGVVPNPTAWDAPNPALTEWLRIGARRQQLKNLWQTFFLPSAEDQEWSDLLNRRQKQQGSLLRFFSWSWYADGKRLKAFRLSAAPPPPRPSPGVPGEGERETSSAPPRPSTGVPGERERAAPTMSELELLSAVIESRRLRKELEKWAGGFAPMFGTEWHGIDSDWPSLERFAASALAVRNLLLTQRVDPAAARRWLDAPDRGPLAASGNSAQSALDHLADCWREWLASIGSDEQRWLKTEFASAELAPIAHRLAELPAQIERLDEWIDLRRCVTECSNTSLRSYIEWALFGDASVARGKLPAVFRRPFYRLWVEEAFAQRESLRGFRGQDHESVIAKFRELDRQWIQLTRERLSEKLAARRQGVQQPAHRLSKLGMLQAEIRKKSRHMPLRKLLEAAGEVVQSIKPCFMMSPLSVAQYLAPGGLAFDLVVFDEASQVEPADAYGAIARGRQLLLVGDERQLPPTNFFGAAIRSSRRRRMRTFIRRIWKASCRWGSCGCRIAAGCAGTIEAGTAA